MSGLLQAAEKAIKHALKLKEGEEFLLVTGFGARIHRGLDIASVGNHIISK